MTISSRRIEWIKKLSSISLLYNLVFGAHFCSKASHGQCCTYELKTTLKLLVHVLAIMANSYLKIVFSQKSGLNPPPPPPLNHDFSLIFKQNFCFFTHFCKNFHPQHPPTWVWTPVGGAHHPPPSPHTPPGGSIPVLVYT